MTNKGQIRILKIAAILAILLQIILRIAYAGNDTYGMDGIKYAVTAYDKGVFSINAPVMSLLGFICRLVRMHPLVFTNTVLAAVMIPLAYLAYMFLFGKMFKDNQTSIYIACLLLCLINIYGYWSGPLSAFSLLTGYFTGYGIFIHMILPVMAGILLNRVPVAFLSERVLQDTRENETDDDYLEEWDMKKHPIINARNLAIALAVVVVILLASVFVLNNKINKLYDATVNLQNQLNEYVQESEE